MGDTFQPVAGDQRAWRAALVAARVTPIDPALEPLPFDLSLARENRRTRVVLSDAALPSALQPVDRLPRPTASTPEPAPPGSPEPPRSARLFRLPYVTVMPRSLVGRALDVRG